MISGVAFQTRARTIDHLGRGQIADSPTAISELWKNAYDAYATNVTLQIFDGDVPVAAIFDDGVGMNRTDIVDRWLVIGTESKLADEPAQVLPEMFGLARRERQGEKGIGRLSAAFLAPATLLVSKRVDGRFVAVMVDWRLFENPYIVLDDIRLPIDEFDHPDEIFDRLAAMAKLLRSNLGNDSKSDNDAENERARRLKDAWDRYSAQEQSRGIDNSTDQIIQEFWNTPALEQRHFKEWPVQIGLVDHGTAIFLLGVHHELAVWVSSTRDDESDLVKERLRETLSGFTDPFSTERVKFSYEVLVHRGGRNEVVVNDRDIFGRDDFLTLEHYIDGEFDELGVFKGRVVVFGKDLGYKEFIPRRPLPTAARERLGPVKFCIGTWEQDQAKTSLQTSLTEKFKVASDSHGGISVYRDGLRVMPYGRPDADFFELEERRTRHAGRYFWSHRRSFGRISFTRQGNPNLRDKAGREGLVENRANRELRLLVIQVLVEFAYKYFGTDSEVRKEMLPEIEARNKASRASADKARLRRRKNIRVFLKEQRNPLLVATNRSKELIAEAEEVKTTKDKQRAALLVSNVMALASERDSLRPPPASAKMGDLEEQYREYRDDFRELTATLEELGNLAADIQSQVGELKPTELLRQTFSRNQALLIAKLDEYLKGITRRLDALSKSWTERAANDRALYFKECSPLLAQDSSGARLSSTLNHLDARKREFEENFAFEYEPFTRALEQLSEGIDLDSALAVTDDERAELELKLRDLHTVAQVGITVEIVGHELESLDAEVRRNLQRLPDDVRKSSAYRLAFEAQGALTERLRFLSPLKVAGYRSKQTIRGSDISEYMIDFFKKLFVDNRISFVATDAFKDMRITDLPSRIYPVFINLINNSIYWLGSATDRRIALDCVDSKVIVADSGPGIDSDDVHRLFDLFFTRRKAGRGVGLYLSKVNLAMGHHQIRYARQDDPKILPGANFVIEFVGIENGDE